MPSDLTLAVDNGFLNLRVGAIIMKDGRFLMVKNPSAGYCYSVGGRIRFGETLEQAVRREVEEETGVRLEIDRLGFVHEAFFYGDSAKTMGKVIQELSFYFYMKTPEDFLPVCESLANDGQTEELIWLSPEDETKCYPAFFKTELPDPVWNVKHIVTDERVHERMNDELLFLLPTAEFAAEYRAYRQEFLDADSSMDGAGPLRRMEDPAEWLREVEKYMHPETVPEDKVQATQFICVRAADRKLVGMLQVRHRFNDYLEKYAGHIGYSVRPSERRRGYAKWMLRQGLDFCRTLGLERVLITCKEENEGSRRTILANGGVYESTVFEPDRGVSLQRYWIDLKKTPEGKKDE